MVVLTVEVMAVLKVNSTAVMMAASSAVCLENRWVACWAEATV